MSKQKYKRKKEALLEIRNRGEEFITSVAEAINDEPLSEVKINVDSDSDEIIEQLQLIDLALLNNAISEVEEEFFNESEDEEELEDED